MITTMVNNRGPESQSRTISIVHTKSPSSMHHSEPECEVHSTIKMQVKRSEQDHHPSTRKNRMGSISSKEDPVFQEQCMTVARWKEQTSPKSEKSNWGSQEEKVNTVIDPKTKENDFLRQKEIVEISNVDEDENNISSSFIFLQEATEDCSIVMSEDECSFIKQLDYENDYFSIPFFDATLDTDDEDSSFCLDLEGTDSEIQATINEIRKEANQMDTIMMMDQLKTLQSEFNSVTKKCSVRSLENKKIKIRLHESEDKVAHLELERDLHQADVTKLRDDLKTVVSKMFDISLYESTKESNDIDENRDTDNNKSLNNHTVKPSTNKIYPTKIEGPETTLNIPGPTLEKIRIVGLVDQPRQPRHVVRRLPVLSDPGLISTHSRSQWSECSDEIHLIPSPKGEVRNQNVFRTRSHHTTSHPRTESIQRVQRPRNFHGKGTRNNFKHRHRSLSVDAKIGTRLIPEMKADDEGNNKLCGMFRRRSKRQSFSRDSESVMKYQISQLHEMMKTSMAASEKLRKRIATISRYYESVISKIQTQVVEIKTEKSRTEVGLTNRLSEADLERRMIVSKFECELRRKDEEIARLKVGADRGEV